MITNKQIDNITNLIYKELDIPQNINLWNDEHKLKSIVIENTLKLVISGTRITFDGIKTVEIMRATLNGIELILQENRKSNK